MLGTTLLNRYRFGFAVREIRMALEFFATLAGVQSEALYSSNKASL
jgi:hypothetical protein